MTKRGKVEMTQCVEVALTGNEFGLKGGGCDRQSATPEWLIEQARAGDAAAFDQIMLRNQRRVISIAWRLLGNEADARDAAQDAFLKVYKYLRSFKIGEDFEGWLYRIIVNACRDIARKRDRRGIVSYEAERELDSCQALTSADDVEADAILSQQRDLIARALKVLSNKERTALVLRDLEGLPTHEVARILGSTQTTVRSQLSSARMKIKKYHGSIQMSLRAEREHGKSRNRSEQ